MGYEDVNVTGKSSLSPQEVDARRKEFAKLRDEGHTIELTARGKNSGVSYDYMDRLNKDIEAGIFEDRTEEGFTKKDKLGLANEFESVFLDHGYIKSKDDFLKMKASNKKGGKSYEITYDEYVKLANAAGYYLVEKTEEPATPKDAKAPDNKPDEAGKQAPTSEPPTPPTSEPPTPPTSESKKKQEQEKPDTVNLTFETITYPNGKKIETVIGDINGQPYHSETGLETFGTVDPEPDAEVKQAAKDKPLVTAPPVEEAPVEEAPVTQTPVAEAPVAEAPKKLDIKQLEMPTGSLTKTQTEFSTASDKLKNIPMPQPSPKETNTQPTATATPKANTSNAKTEFDNMVNSDPQLANKTDKERAEILKTKASNIETEISNLQRATVTYKKRLFGTKRIHTTAEENREKNKEQIAKLEQELDTAKRNSTYANAIAGNITGFGATSLVNKNGNTVANYPQYTTVKYRDANGQEYNVAKVKTYNKTTHKDDISYYPFDVQKVNDLKGQPERWQAVPDMKNELTGGEEIRN